MSSLRARVKERVGSTEPARSRPNKMFHPSRCEQKVPVGLEGKGLVLGLGLAGFRSKAVGGFGSGLGWAAVSEAV